MFEPEQIANCTDSTSTDSDSLIEYHRCWKKSKHKHLTSSIPLYISDKLRPRGRGQLQTSK